MTMPKSQPGNSHAGTSKRDASRSRTLAALRQQRRRNKIKAENVRSIRVELGEGTALSLQAVAKLTKSSIKAETEALLSRMAPAYLREIKTLVEKAGDVWSRALPFLPYAQFLKSPGSHFRIGSRTVTHEEWAPIYNDLTAIYAGLGKWGWSRSRIETFLKRSAKESATEKDRQ